MMNKTLYMTCGPAGSGKSTWCLEFQRTHPRTAYFSRDNFRFAILSDTDHYFSKEKESFSNWIKAINDALANENVDIVIADASHLNQKARNKVLDKLKLENVNIIMVNFITSFEKCIQNNSGKTGRRFVPENVISDMKDIFIPAVQGEKYKYFDILTEGN